MNRIIALSALCSVLLVTGCKTDTAPSPGYGDPYPAPMNDPQISMLSPELSQWLVFQPAVIVDDDKRPMHVEVPVRNTTYNQYLIEYRFLFYDDTGRELKPAMGWKPQALDSKQIARLNADAMSNDAETYKLEVRWSK